MPDRLEFRHPQEVRKAAATAYRKHGSIRRAAAALGVGKSTLHDWITADATGEPQGDPADAPVDADLADEGSETPGVEARVDAEGMRQADQASELSSAPVEGTVPTVLQHLTDPLYLQAFRRYVSALANGTHPLQAVATAQAVHPDFRVTEADNARVLDAVGRILLSEGGHEALWFASTPPAYVQGVYSDYAMDDTQAASLADVIGQIRSDAYLAAINAQLSALDRPMVAAITDHATITSIQTDAAAAAHQIAETWNRDAASAVGARWLEVAPGSRLRGEAVLTPSERQDEVRAGMDDWLEGRKDWKAALWATDQASRGYSTAVSDFVSRNAGAAQTGHVEPDGAQCDECRALVQMGEVDTDTLGLYDFPVHPGCDHQVVMTYAAWDAATSGDLWAAQADDGDEEEGAA